MDIRMYSLQLLEKEREEILNKEAEEGIRKNLQAEKRSIEEDIKAFKTEREEADKLQREIKKKEDEDSLLTEEIERKEKDLYQNSKANFKELEAIKENIEELKELLKNNEEKYLDMIGLAEKKEEELARERESIRDKKSNFNRKIKDFQEREKESKILLAEKEKEIEDFASLLSQENYNKYKAMMKKFPGSGIAVIEDKGKCSHCRLEVSVVKLRAVESGNITYCENCSRLLVGKKEEIK